MIREFIHLALVEAKKKKGKCPPEGCVVKRGSNWRVVSNKTGKLWPQKYKTKESAKGAIAGYHMSR